MDREFLQDYQHAEREEIDKFYKRIHDGDFGPNDFYPPNTRFSKLRKPLISAWQIQIDLNIPDVIWSQIPLSGSLIIDLMPVPARDFRENHGFDIQDIPKVFDFSKETGKVQFGLAYDATFYENLNHLDDIFQELKPPLRVIIPPESMLTKQEIDKYKIEFEELSRLKFIPMLSHRWDEYDEDIFSEKQFRRRYLAGIASPYICLRALGKHDVADHILNALLDDPELADILLIVYGYLLTHPLFDAQRTFHNFGLEFITGYSKYLKDKDRLELLTDIKLPCEIGALLMKKLTPYPPSFRAMELLVDKYKHEDLYKIMEALNNGIKAKSPDILTRKTMELDEILDNIWKDSKKIKQEIKEINFGTSVTLGLVGPIVGYLIAGFTGFLTALGLAVVEKSIDFFGTSISESIVRKLSPSYLVGVYDFKNKYSIE